MDKPLLFLPLGGSGEIGMNLNLYSYDDQWVMVDCGMTFADPHYPGIDLILPDISFIEDKLLPKRALLGIVLTHGHEDHIGALPYLAADLDVPLYATPFTAALIRHKLEEAGLTGEVVVREIPMGGDFSLGPFGFRYVHLAHSIPEGNALLISTPLGRIFHTGDWKLDDEPLIGHPSTPQSLKKIGDEGVLAYVGDSTNVFNAQASGSESGVRDTLLELVKTATGRVVVTTFASNAARLHTLGKVAAATGRSLFLAGRSMERITRIAKNTGYLKGMPADLPLEELAFMPADQVLIACTGCQGEPKAALSRIAARQHPTVRLEQGDTVIFSSKKIPGNELSIANVCNELVRAGIQVVTEKDAHVHVSGHPGQPELEAMLGWLRPQIAVPVHGEDRHMQAHAALAKRCGVPQQIVPTNGAIIILAPGEPTISGHVPHGRLVVDGDVIITSDSMTLTERRRLMMSGFMGVTVVVGKEGKLAASPHFVIQGVPLEDDHKPFVKEAEDMISQAMAKAKGDLPQAKELIRVGLRRLARSYTGKKPVTEVSLIKIAEKAESTRKKR